MNSFSKIGLGTVQFGLPYGISNELGQTSPHEVSLILKLAKENGIQLIDTAFAYGNAEKVLGENDLTSFNVVSKFMGLEKQETPLTQLKITLRSLNIASLYGYLAHRPMDILDNHSCWGDLQDAKSSGLIKKIGFSLNHPEELDLLLNKDIIPDIIQVPYNYLDRRFERMMIESKKTGCEIHSRSAFLQGLFFSNTDSLSTFFDEVKPIIKQLQTSTKNLSSSLLKFVLAQPFIDKVIIGVNNVEQIKINLDGLNASDILPQKVFSISDNILMPSKWPTV